MEFDIREKLNKGCFKAVNINSGKLFVIKKISYNAKIPKWVEETKIHSSLDHENIVKFYDKITMSSENCFGFVLEYCMHGSLFDMIQASGKGFDLHDISKYTYDITMGLLYLHDNGIVHFDIKLGNIMVDETNTAKIGDFGFAIMVDKIVEHMTCIAGTPNYISPEMLTKKCTKLGFAADIWSLGCTVYAMHTMIPPFETKSKKETFKRIKAVDWTPPDDMPKQITEFVGSCLQLEPTCRPEAGVLIEYFDLLSEYKMPFWDEID